MKLNITIIPLIVLAAFGYMHYTITRVSDKDATVISSKAVLDQVKKDLKSGVAEYKVNK